MFLVLLAPVLCMSQNNFKPGFIVKANGDTTRGFVEPIETKKINNKVSFALTGIAQPASYTTADLKAFGYDNENTFEKVVYNNPFDSSYNERFVKVLIRGYYTLYTFWNNDIKYFIVKTPENIYHFLSDIDMASSGFVHQQGNYKNELLFLSISCNELKPEIDGLEYTDNTIIKYVSKLNKCVSPATSSNVVYKKEKSKLNVYAYAGGMVLGKGHEFTGKILGRLTVPSVDKNLSLNFGINYMNYQKTSLATLVWSGYPYTKEQTANKTIISIPLTIQYYFTNGFIKPYIDAGLSLDYFKRDGELLANGHELKESKFGPAFTAAFGIDGFITSKLSVRADYRYELFLHYPTVGVSYIF